MSFFRLLYNWRAKNNVSGYFSILFRLIKASVEDNFRGSHSENKGLIITINNNYAT